MCRRRCLIYILYNQTSLFCIMSSPPSFSPSPSNLPSSIPPPASLLSQFPLSSTPSSSPQSFNRFEYTPYINPALFQLCFRSISQPLIHPTPIPSNLSPSSSSLPPLPSNVPSLPATPANEQTLTNHIETQKQQIVSTSSEESVLPPSRSERIFTTIDTTMSQTTNER